MKAPLAAVLGASPLVLHLAIVWDSRPLLAGFAGMIALGAVLGSRTRRVPAWALLLVALGVAGLALLEHGSVTQLAFAWPVVAYLAIAWVFGRTLRRGRMPLVEHMARLIDHGEHMPPELVRYTRTLTWFWTLLPLGLAAVSVLLARFASPAAWSLFTNVLGYAALAALFFAEYPYRVRRYPQYAHTNPLTVAARLAQRAPELFR
ncbi:MAG: hypothetical protein KJ025_21510 [Burkholderiales bacterium]|nr:hypothetical protein [Burkholderiales bacterium]